MTKKRKPTIKIHHYIAKKPYLNGKNTYPYERMLVPIPKTLQHKILPYSKSRLEIDIIEQNNRLMIILDPVKTVSHTRKKP
jgi:hypothetical protein